MAENKPFVPGQDWVWYNRAVYGQKEIEAVLESLNSDWLVPGEYSRRFEKAVADLFGHEHGLFVNSGSSANLIGTQVLHLPSGSEVITPACTFSTTVNPLLQLGLIPVFVDVEADTFNINLDLIEPAITKKTSALCIPHLVGNLNDVKKIRQIADKYNLKYIEDSCDTIGSKIDGEPTGKYADISTTSFYASHIITAAGGGGMVAFHDEDQVKEAKIIRDWGRALPEHWDESPDKRFNFSLGGIAYDGKFVFTHFGYNLKPIDLQAAFGLVQLQRLDEFDKIRKHNFSSLKEFFSQYPEHFVIPRQLPNGDVRWLAYPIILKDSAPIKRMELMRYLEDHKIQTRVLFTGNILHHPAYQNIPHRKGSDLSNADYVFGHCVLIGCHHGLRDEHINYVKSVISDYIKKVS